MTHRDFLNIFAGSIGAVNHSAFLVFFSDCGALVLRIYRLSEKYGKAVYTHN